MKAWARLQQGSGVSGLVLLTLCALYGLFHPALFFEGYLVAFLFWIEIALGCQGLLLLQNLTGGRWGQVLSRTLDAGMMTLPLCALFFVPILFGLTRLFSWTHPLTLEMAQVVHGKRAYLNVPFYLVRNAVYFVVLCALAVWLRGLGLRRDGNDPHADSTLRKISGPALIIFVLLMNFAAIDWIMCLNPEWYSSMLVVEFIAEQAVVTMAAGIVALHFLARMEPMRSALNKKVVHDCGNLLLALTCFWTYVTFMEYIITWTGNLPHEVSWFSARSSLGWKLFAAVLVMVHFVIPMFCLIFTSISKNLKRLSQVAALILTAHFVQVVWWIEPAFGSAFHIAWTSVVLTMALGFIWLSVFLQNLGAVPVLPRELRAQKSVEVPG